jgi:mono/diheme cytochrome c family protein
MERMKNMLLRALLITAIAAGVAFWSTPATAEAAATYKTKCAMCHGADGKGETPVGKKMGARDFASPEVQKETDDELTAIIAKGKNKMPAYEKSLKDTDIKEMVAFIRQLAKGK